MKHYVKFASVLSASTLLGCAQLSWVPMLGQPPLAVRTSGAPLVQSVDRQSNTVSEVEGLFSLGGAAHRAGQLALAEDRYLHVLNKQPAHLGALNGLAVLYAQTQRMDQALVVFKRALELDRKAAHIHNNLGYAFLMAGRLTEAESELAVAHELNPQSAQTRQNLELLSQAKEAAMVGPQLVAVGRNIYELRDPPVKMTDQTQTLAHDNLLIGQAAIQISMDSVVKDIASVSSLRGVRIEVSNGVGIRFLARRTAARLARLGVITARMTNQPRYQQAKTEIQFEIGQEAAAIALSRQLPVAVKTLLSPNLQRKLQLRLVLGHDLSGKAIAAWLDSVGETRVALIGPDN